MRATVFGLSCMLALATAPAAEAATMRAVVSGIVETGTDHAGLFGGTGPVDLTGLPAQLVFVYDTERGLRSGNAPGDSFLFDLLVSDFDDPDPIFLSATVVIDGASFALPEPASGNVLVQSETAPGGFWSYEHIAVLRQGGVEYRLSSSIFANAVGTGFDPTVSLEAPYAIDAFDLSVNAFGDGSAFFAFTGLEEPFAPLASASIAFPDIRIAPVGVIPLPAGGWLLLGALGVLAAAGRRRRGA